MRRFLHDHGLSLLFAVLLIVQTGVWVAAKLVGGWWKEWVSEWMLSVLAESAGMFILVLATKRLVEKGSAESKDESEELEDKSPWGTK